MDLKTNKDNLVEYILKNGKSKSWEELKKMFNLPTSEIARHAWKNYKLKKINEKTIINNEIASSEDRIVQLTEDLKRGIGEATLSFNKEIKSLKDLESFIDTEKWIITKYTQASNSGKFSVKAWLELKKSSETTVLEKIFSNYKSNWKPINRKDLILNKSCNDSLLFLNLNDLHFDKLDLDNNTIDDRIKDYKRCLEDLLKKSYSISNLEEILFVIGNDMFNTDTFHNTTTNGTPQSINSSWDIAYEKVFDTMVDSISLLSSMTKKLTVMLVSGNHDRTKSFYLTHALQVYFKNDPNIIFDRSSKLKKYYTYGNTFLGLNHGNNINDKLPLSFATEFYSEWGKCKYHDIYISDKHHNNNKIFQSNQTQNEFQGVRLRILPSLTGTDSWHSDNLYHSRQSGIGILYTKDRGKFAEFEYQL